MILPKKSEYSKILRGRLSCSYYTELSYESKKNLSNLLRGIIDGENNSENQRKFLNSGPSFSSYENFEFVKGMLKSSILKEDIASFMKDNSFYLTNFELDLLFERLDKNQDGKISFNEFIHELLPRFQF